MSKSSIRQLDGLRAELVDFRRRWQALRVYWAREHGITTREQLATRMKRQRKQVERWQEEAKNELAESAANLFMEEFVPLAARIVETLGEDKFTDVLEAPPPAWRSNSSPSDSLLVDLFGTEDTHEMGKRAIMWAARANDTHCWRRADDYPRRVKKWARLMVVDPDEEGEPKWRTLGQPIRNALWFLEQRQNRSPKRSARGRQPRESEAKASGGRKRKWDDLVRLDEELRAKDPSVTDEKVVAAYRRKYSRRETPTAKNLRDARRYRGQRHK